MGYRFSDMPPRKPEDFLPVFDMFNNEKRVWSIPCFYFDVEKPIDWHDYKLHDHLGWPNPDVPGHICQALPDYGKYSFSPASVWHYVDMDNAIPIHLSSEYEGYTTVSVVFDTVDEEGESVSTSGITAQGSIRSEEDWIVDLTFDITIAHFAGKPKEYLFNVYIAGDDRKDLLVRGKLVVLPG